MLGDYPVAHAQLHPPPAANRHTIARGDDAGLGAERERAGLCGAPVGIPRRGNDLQPALSPGDIREGGATATNAVPAADNAGEQGVVVVRGTRFACSRD